jgi:sorting and assembly machinery component 37
MLPCLQHGHARAAGLPAVLHTAARAGHDLDAHLARAERAQRTAWCAHAAQHLGALVVRAHGVGAVTRACSRDTQAHALYGLPANWAGLAQPALAAGLPVPHRYYVPGRVRDAHRPRLAAAGLWAVPGEEEEEGGDAAEPRPFADRLRARRAPEKMPGQHFKDTFGRQKVSRTWALSKLPLSFEIGAQVLQKARTVLDSYQMLLGDARFVFGDQ